MDSQWQFGLSPVSFHPPYRWLFRYRGHRRMVWKQNLILRNLDLFSITTVAPVWVCMATLKSALVLQRFQDDGRASRCFHNSDGHRRGASLSVNWMQATKSQAGANHDTLESMTCYGIKQRAGCVYDRLLSSDGSSSDPSL
mmetsp:Transcript_22650/g.52282  ORF Transcript_22650/g.52282 Transcript_22650/m.52282 type:complete len:141 (-) Transcript_22650:538-960(-)